MNKDEWMSEFYDRPWYRVEDQIDSTDKYDNCLLEWRINVQDYKKVLKAQSLGFEIVETFVEFRSEVNPDTKTYDEVESAEESNLEEILSITNSCMLDNDRLYTRFKNPKYFSKAQCKEYYKLSVLNNFFNENTITVITKDQDGLTGYYMIKEIQENIFKGIMTGVLPRARGKSLHIKMQRYIFNIIGRNINVINTTQLGNFGIIKNHMKEGRTLSKIEHILFLKK